MLFFISESSIAALYEAYTVCLLLFVVERIFYSIFRFYKDLRNLHESESTTFSLLIHTLSDLDQYTNGVLLLVVSVNETIRKSL